MVNILINKQIYFIFKSAKQLFQKNFIDKVNKSSLNNIHNNEYNLFTFLKN